MFICLNCGEKIDCRQDDNYNAQHSKIQCPSCKKWFWVNELENNRLGGGNKCSNK